MAVTEQRTLPAQFVETLGKDLATQITGQSGIPMVSTGIAGISQQPGETAAAFKARQDAAQAFTTRQSQRNQPSTNNFQSRQSFTNQPFRASPNIWFSELNNSIPNQSRERFERFFNSINGINKLPGVDNAGHFLPEWAMEYGEGLINKYMQLREKFLLEKENNEENIDEDNLNNV